MEKFRIMATKFIICLYGFLITLTLIGTIRSSNLNLENVSARIFLIPILLGGIFLFYKFMKKRSYLSNLITAIIAFLVVVGLQMVFIKLTHTAIGFDVKHFTQVNQYHKDESNYFGMYPNNMLLLVIQHEYLELIKKIDVSYWLKLDILNVFLVDISAIFNIFLIKIISKKDIIKAIWIQNIWLMLTPMIIVPYSDTFVLPFVSLELIIGILFLKSKSLKIKGLMSFFVGILVTITYFIKPSSVIPVIALGMVYTFFVKLGKVPKEKILHSGIIFIIFVTSSYLSFRLVNNVINSQNFTTIKQSKEVPAIHFIDMGMIGEGGYNYERVIEMDRLKNKEERKKASLRSIDETLNKRGILGYIKFLFLKQGYNTSDGTFGWLKEGNFIIDENRVRKNIFTNYVFPSGKYLSDYTFITQLVWITVILLLVLGTNYTEKGIWFKLSVIGGFMFLLIFEGGRSRYLIQFLPVILTELTLVSTYSFTKIKRIIDILKSKNV